MLNRFLGLSEMRTSKGVRVTKNTKREHKGQYAVASLKFDLNKMLCERPDRFIAGLAPSSLKE